MKQERVTYYVRYKKDKNKSSIKSLWKSSLKSIDGTIDYELDVLANDPDDSSLMGLYQMALLPLLQMK